PLQERDELGVVRRDLECSPLAALGESLDVAGREALELLLRHLDGIAGLVDVALELDLQLHEAGPEALELRADLGINLLPGPAEVAQPDVEEVPLLAGQRLCIVGGLERCHRAVQVWPEREPHAPLGQTLV